MIRRLSAACLILLAFVPIGSALGQGETECIRGVMLRAQALPPSANGAAETRALLSTDEGLCAVRLPGEAEDWGGYADATVEIFGTLEDGEFVVGSKSAVHILKYPPLNPQVIPDVLPAGEVIYRRRVEAEIARHRRNLHWAWISVAGIAAAVVILCGGLLSYVLGHRRRMRHLLVGLLRDNRRTDHLHESMEQRLTAARLLLQVALDMVDDPKSTPLGAAAAQAADVIAKTNRDLHACASEPRLGKKVRT